MPRWSILGLPVESSLTAPVSFDAAADALDPADAVSPLPSSLPYEMVFSPTGGKEIDSGFEFELSARFFGGTGTDDNCEGVDDVDDGEKDDDPDEDENGDGVDKVNFTER